MLGEQKAEDRRLKGQPVEYQPAQPPDPVEKEQGISRDGGMTGQAAMFHLVGAQIAQG